MIQFGLAFCGLVSLWMAMGTSARARFFAPWVGLVGQPFWLAFALQAQAAGVDARGLLVTVGCFTIVYLRGAWVQWSARKPRQAAGLRPPSQAPRPSAKVIERPTCAVFRNGEPVPGLIGTNRRALRQAAGVRYGSTWHKLWKRGFRVGRWPE